MTDKIKELKGICDRATKGPWEARLRMRLSKGQTVFGTKETGDGHILGFIYAGSKQKDDVQFIATARTALPAALELIEEMAGILDRQSNHDNPPSEILTALQKYEDFKGGKW